MKRMRPVCPQGRDGEEWTSEEEGRGPQRKRKSHPQMQRRREQHGEGFLPWGRDREPGVAASLLSRPWRSGFSL